MLSRFGLVVALTLFGCSYPDFEFVPPATDAQIVVDVNADSAVDANVVTDTEQLDSGPDSSDASNPGDTKDAAPVLRTWLFDFGNSATTTPGYNNVTEAHVAGATLPSLIDSTGAMTTASLRMDGMDRFHRDNEAGNLMPPAVLGFPATATRDSLYGSTMVFDGVARPRAVIELLGFDPALGYDIEIYASRMAGTGVLETAYAVRGVAAPVTLTLNANNNTGTTVKFTKVRPTSMGWMSLTMTAGPGNTNPFGFYYIGAMRIIAVVP